MVCIKSSSGRSAASSQGRCAAAMPMGTPISTQVSVAKTTMDKVSMVSPQYPMLMISSSAAPTNTVSRAERCRYQVRAHTRATMSSGCTHCSAPVKPSTSAPSTPEIRSNSQGAPWVIWSTTPEIASPRGTLFPVSHSSAASKPPSMFLLDDHRRGDIFAIKGFHASQPVAPGGSVGLEPGLRGSSRLHFLVQDG